MELVWKERLWRMQGRCRVGWGKWRAGVERKADSSSSAIAYNHNSAVARSYPDKSASVDFEQGISPNTLGCKIGDRADWLF